MKSYMYIVESIIRPNIIQKSCEKLNVISLH